MADKLITITPLMPQWAKDIVARAKGLFEFTPGRPQPEKKC